MAAEDDGVPAGQTADQRADLDDLPGVQADRGLVQDDDLREAEDRLGEAHPLPVALGKVPDQPVPHGRQLGELHDLVHRVGPSGPGELLQLRCEGEVLQGRHVRIQGRLFGQVADAAPDRVRLLEQIVAVDGHAAVGHADVAGEYVHGGGLPGAVGAEESVDLAVVHGEAEMIQHRVAAVLLDQIADFYHADPSSGVRIVILYPSRCDGSENER